ncbi:MAG: hypothetical protein IKV32_03660 [Muribaculaceae bacterium]|nr:hypothetical protein [Muribaculaceae bacterium]
MSAKFERNKLIESTMQNELNYFANPLVEHMCSMYRTPDIYWSFLNLMRRYCVGITHNDGVVYWQVGKNGECNLGKVVRYDSNGEACKWSDIEWLSLDQSMPTNQLQRYPFGLHLLPNHPQDVSIAVVANEVSALLAMTYNVIYLRNDKQLPLYIATGGMGTMDTLQHLQGRNVTLFPDDDLTETWTYLAQMQSDKFKSIEVCPMVRNMVNRSLLPPGSTFTDMIATWRQNKLRRV